MMLGTELRGSVAEQGQGERYRGKVAAGSLCAHCKPLSVKSSDSILLADPLFFCSTEATFAAVAPTTEILPFTTLVSSSPLAGDAATDFEADLLPDLPPDLLPDLPTCAATRPVIEDAGLRGWRVESLRAEAA